MLAISDQYEKNIYNNSAGAYLIIVIQTEYDSNKPPAVNHEPQQVEFF